MPQYTRPRKQRQSRKPTAWYNKKYSAAEAAGKALSGVRYLKTLINAEAKHVDINVNGQTVNNSAGSITHISSINQGDSAQTRDGLSVFTKGINIRGCIQGNALSPSNLVRILIIMDSQNTGTPPVSSDIFETTGNQGAPLQPMKYTSFGRFKILYTNTFTLNTNGNHAQVFKAYITLRKHIKYTGPNATDEQKNQIYLVAISDVATNDPLLTFSARLSFYDN